MNRFRPASHRGPVGVGRDRARSIVARHGEDPAARGLGVRRAYEFDALAGRTDRANPGERPGPRAGDRDRPAMVENAEAVARYFACVNAEDWDGLRELWHSDGEMRAVGAVPRVGREQVIHYFIGVFDPWAAHYDTPTRVILAGDVVTVEIRFEGVTTDGVSVAFDAVDLFDFRSGLIWRLSNWYDLLYVRRMLADAAAQPR